MRNFFIIIPLLALTMLLISCGQTGPLYLPMKSKPAVQQHTVVKP